MARLFCDPMDCSLLGSSVRGIYQAKTLEWVAISFSRGSSWLRKSNPYLLLSRQILYYWATWEAPTTTYQFSHSVVSDSWQPLTAAHQALLSTTNSWALLKLTSIKSVMPSNHLILCCSFTLWCWSRSSNALATWCEELTH